MYKLLNELIEFKCTNQLSHQTICQALSVAKADRTNRTRHFFQMFKWAAAELIR
jgi:hypothetical protein